MYTLTWTPQEDKLLHGLVIIKGFHAWQSISMEIGTKSPVDCQYRWNEMFASNTLKGNWCLEEDQIIAEAAQSV
jgi:hypothetical protein